MLLFYELNLPAPPPLKVDSRCSKIDEICVPIPPPPKLDYLFYFCAILFEGISSNYFVFSLNSKISLSF
jgi:hypothetical protein